MLQKGFAKTYAAFLADMELVAGTAGKPVEPQE